MLTPEQLAELTAEKQEKLDLIKDDIAVDEFHQENELVKFISIYSTVNCLESLGFELAMCLPGMVSDMTNIPDEILHRTAVYFKQMARRPLMANFGNSLTYKLPYSDYLLSFTIDTPETIKQKIPLDLFDGLQLQYFGLAIAKHQSSTFDWRILTLTSVKPVYQAPDIIH